MSNNEILTMAIIPEVEFPFFVLSLSIFKLVKSFVLLTKGHLINGKT